MASLRLAFEPGGPERVGVDWQGGWKDVAIHIDGRRVGGFENAGALRQGGHFRLADGSTLEIKLAQLPLPELRVSCNGVPLPGSPSDPVERVRRAGLFISAIGALSAGLGVLAALFGVGFLRDAGFGLGSAALSVLFAALGVPAGRGSLTALAAAVALYVVDGGFALVHAATAGMTFVPIARILFLIPMVQGLLAGLELRRRPRTKHHAPPAPTPSGASTGATSPVAPPRDDAAARHRRELEARGRDATPARGAARDRSADSLRFVAPKLELLDGGVRVVALDGRRREVSWQQLREVLVRKLPIDPPWNGAVLLDLVPAEGAPVRVLPATLVSFALLPGGAAPSRLENVRRLARLAAERSNANVDTATRSFLEGTGHPASFATVHDLAEHDARFA